MKILMLNYEFPPIGGGAANATYYILKEFINKKDIKIDLVTSSSNKYKVDNFSKNIKIHYLNIGKNNNFHFQSNKQLLVYSWKAYWYSKKLIKKEKYDLIHAFFGIPCGYIALKLGLPYIVSLRGSDVPFYNKRFNVLYKLFFKNLSKKIWEKALEVIANSEGLKNLALKTNSKQRISVIYNGIDLKEFTPKINKKNNNKIILISTSRLIRRKGHKYIIEALRGMNNFCLYLLGDGILKDNINKLAEENNVEVHFLGNIKHEEIPNYLKKSDIFILSSLNEGMSNSVLEAMACGLPVIVSDVGGSKELLKGNGFVLKKGDVAGIKSALLKYENNRELIYKHGKRSREIAEKMSWQNVADGYCDIYNKCIKNVFLLK